MAKSARASQIKTNRANLRKKVFNPADNARNERLSAKLMQIASQPKPVRDEPMQLETETSKSKNKPTEADEADPADALMDIDETTEPSKTTSRSKKPRSIGGRIQKKRRGKSATTITFPAYSNGKRLPTKSRKRR